MSELSITPNQYHNNPLKFLFGNSPIQVIPDENNEPLFVASEVCNAVGVTNVSQALTRLDNDEKSEIILNDVTGRPQMTAVVNESGLYTLVLSSRKPIAKEFKRWITHEVIPAIRKTGSYSMQNASPLQLARQMLEALENQQVQLDDHASRITSLESHVQTEVEYFTVIGYFRKRGLPTPSMNEAQSIGQRASHLSRSKGYGIGKTTDARYGEVNTYHVSILDEVTAKPRWNREVNFD